MSPETDQQSVDRYKVFRSIIEEQELSSHVDPYNQLLSEWIGSLIRKTGCYQTIYVENGKRYLFDVTMNNYRYERQDVTPTQAYRENLNYAVDFLIDMEMNVYLLPDIKQPSPKARRNMSLEDMDAEIKRKAGEKQRDLDERVLLRTQNIYNHILCSFPCMVGSDACILSDGFTPGEDMFDDPHGTFIMRGNKCIISDTEQPQSNCVFLLRKKGDCMVEVRSEHLGEHKLFRSTSTICILCTSPTPKQQSIGHPKRIEVDIPFSKHKVPILTVILALGFRYEDFERITKLYTKDYSKVKDYMLRIKHAVSYRNEENAKDIALFIIAKVLDKPHNENKKATLISVENTIFSEIFPHLNYDEPEMIPHRKLNYLAWTCSLLMDFEDGRVKATDKNSYQNIILQNAGYLLGQLFRMNLADVKKKAIDVLRRTLSSSERKKRKIHTPPQDRIDLRLVHNQSRLTGPIMSAVSMGQWSEQRKGVSTQFKLGPKVLIQSQQRKIRNPSYKSNGKHVSQRLVHPDSCGYVSPAETPEGEHCGLVYTRAITAQVTPKVDGTIVMQIVYIILGDLFVPMTLDQLEPPMQYMTTLIGASGVLSGWITDPQTATRRLRTKRRQGHIDKYTSFVYDKNKNILRVKTCAGRLSRPLIVVENMHKIPKVMRLAERYGLFNIPMLLQEGIIEYLDPSESCGSYDICVATDVAMIEDFHSHMEMSDIFFMGFATASICFANNNQGPRISYYDSLMKQLMNPENTEKFGSVTVDILHTAQRPIVRTEMQDENDTFGVVAVVAIITDDNEEDAIIMKKEFLDRNALNSSTINTHSATHTIRAPSQKQEKFEKPDPETTLGLKRLDVYSKIQANGLPKVGTRVSKNDVVIGKTIPGNIVGRSARVKSFAGSDNNNVEYRRCVSVGAKLGGYITSVEQTGTLCKVKVSTFHTPEQADKYTPRSGQKGTIGRIVQQQDMPFCEQTGIIPDILIGPSSQPSRMTVGFLLELLVGKAVLLTASMELGIDKQIFNCTYKREYIKKIMNILKKCGYNSNGTEIMRCGKTGKLFTTQIMIGPMSYGKVQQLANKKLYTRSTGPVEPWSRQPSDGGRKNNGGLKQGYMEGTAKTDHGGFEVISERMNTLSDKVEVYICGKCGQLCQSNRRLGIYVCQICSDSQYIRKVAISKTALNMLNIIACNGIKSTLTLRDLPH